MAKPFCELSLFFSTQISEHEELQSTYIATCVLNSFLCYSAVMLNFVAIYAIRKTSSVPKALKTLLLSLTVSDVGVGLLGQPLHISLLIMWLQQHDPVCNTYKGSLMVSVLFCIISFFGVVALSVDRFLAIHLHLRYQELVTHKRVVSVVILIWVFSVFISLMIWWVLFDIIRVVIIILGVVAFVVTTVVYIRIYLAVQRLRKNQIHVLQVQQATENNEITNLANIVKSTFGIFYVFLLFLFCSLPSFICIAVFQISGPSIPLKKVFLFSCSLLFLNSSLNPVIYCWKMRQIRHAVIKKLRNISWLRNDN